MSALESKGPVQNSNDLAAVSRRLAVTEINTRVVTCSWIFKIMENLLGGKVISVKMYASPQSIPYYIVEFEHERDAKRIYDQYDGVSIEDTSELFNLSFVPEGMVLKDPVEECFSSRDFVYEGHRRKTKDETEAIQLELSEEEEERILEQERVKADRERAKAANKEILRDEKVKEILEEPVVEKEDEGYEFNIHDPRFECILNDDDFMLDASNEKFKKQAESKEILKEKRKKET